jgi:hypothetical protein
MHCPECQTLLDPASTFCERCGLLLLNSEPPKRRREDLASERRRSEDAAARACPFCHGENAAEAVRCKHCSEVIDEEFRRQKLQRRRSQLNYASWVAYIFGLFLFLVFRPVGLIVVGIGLMLSVLYYAIPVEEIPGEKKSFWKTFRRQLKFERAAIPVPHFRRARLVLVGSPAFAAVVGYLANFFLLQQPMNEIIEQNPNLRGVAVQAHYAYWVIPGVVVYDLREVSGGATPVHVHTVLLEYARALRERSFDRVELQYRGQSKLWVEGSVFRKLGDEYDKQNFDFVLLDFARLVKSKSGPGPLTETADAREALIALHQIWYGDEVISNAQSMQPAPARPAVR